MPAWYRLRLRRQRCIQCLHTGLSRTCFLAALDVPTFQTATWRSPSAMDAAWVPLGVKRTARTGSCGGVPQKRR